MRDEVPPILLIMTSLKMLIRHLRLVEYAHELGVAPVMVFNRSGETGRLSELMDDPAHPLSRLAGVIPVEAPTVNAVLAGVADPAGRGAVRGVLSCGEYFVEPAAALAHLLGLPGPGWNAATISRDKLLQRYALPGHAPCWRVIPPGGREHAADAVRGMAGPLVVKPTGRMSSSGVVEVRTADELPAVLETYPPHETLLVEERVTGAEYSVETLVQHGEPVWCGITAKGTNEGGGAFVETSHTVPAEGLTPGQTAALTGASADVLRRLGVQDAVAHAEFRMADRGPVLMEVALRVPGGGISVLWGLATGASMEERLVDLALGRPVSYPAPIRRARHDFLPHPPGRLADVRHERAPVTWTVRDARWPELPPAAPGASAACRAVLVSKMPGDDLGPLTDGDARAVSVMVDAPLDEDITRQAERAGNQTDVVVE